MITVITKTINITSGKIRVSDPGYELDYMQNENTKKLVGELESVKNGQWVAEIVMYLSDDRKLSIEKNKKDTISIMELHKELSLKNPDHDRYIEMFAAKLKQYDEYLGRVKSIKITHSDFLNQIEDSDYEKEQGFDVGVDSGQAGFFDSDFFERLFVTEAYKNFYNEVGDMTNTFGYSVGDSFAVSLSGYGDGYYSCFSSRKNGKLVSAYIEFISENV